VRLNEFTAYNVQMMVLRMVTCGFTLDVLGILFFVLTNGKLKILSVKKRRSLLMNMNSVDLMAGKCFAAFLLKKVQYFRPKHLLHLQFH